MADAQHRLAHARVWAAAGLAAVLAGLAACVENDSDKAESNDASAPAATGPANAAPARHAVQRDDPYFIAAAARLEAMRAAPRRTGAAKNLILFVGDGMGISTVTAARIYAGQAAGGDGESHVLAVDRFPHHALSRTYSHDFQVADSAATATAMMTGVKTRTGVVNVASSVGRGDCAAALDAPVTSLFEMAEMAGRATGVVSTARLTHATPAAVYAHSANRSWETDVALGEAAALGCIDIARQLIEWPAGDGLEIALGGGRRNFLPQETADPEYPDQTGARGDGRNLTAEWAAKSAAHRFIWSAEHLAQADLAGGAKLLGLFEPSHLQYETDRENDPSLTAMTEAAITRLSQSEDGYVLLVESGRIDHAHHAGQAGRALPETVAFDAAIARALELTRRDDTLIVVTADHSHTLTLSGYQARGTPILGLAAGPTGGLVRAADGLPYTSLGYANGPGASGVIDRQTGRRRDLSDVDVTHKDFRQPALVPSLSETHSGEDVSIYAWGPQAHLISGTVEQNYIFHVLAFAGGL